MRRRIRKSAAARAVICAALLALAFAAVRADPARAGETLAQLLLLSPEMPETAAESAVILPGRAEPDTAAESPPPHEPEEETAPAAPPAAQADGADVTLPEAYVPELTNHTQYKAWSTGPDLTDVPALRMDGTAEVLIVHTHSSEAFTADGEDPYLPSDGMRTLDTTYISAHSAVSAMAP